MNSDISLTLDLGLSPHEAFEALTQELSLALERHSITMEPRPAGQIRQKGRKIGQVIAWEPGKRAVFRWQPLEWEDGKTTEIELRLEPLTGGTRVTLTHRGWEQIVSDPRELAGWFASEAAAPFLAAAAPLGFGDWLTDRRARRPSGAASRQMYQNPLYHLPNFKVILAELALKADDYLIEIGCGGGALLHEALKSGCRAAAIDHSLDMVRLARQVNADAIKAGRLVIEQANADRLPFADTTFSCAAMTGVLGFLPDPVAAFREIWRVLRPGGRVVVFGSDEALRGTPAAPEPMASRLRFYNDDQLRKLGIDGGFANARVVRRDLLPYAREVGVPAEHLPLFAAGPAPFLVASKA